MWTVCAPKQLGLVGFQRVWWDPVHQHYVVMNNGLFQALDVDGNLYGSVPVKDSQIAMLAKYSLDMNIIAIQITNTSMIVAEVSGGRTWIIECKGPGNSLLQSGFIWSDHGGNSQDLLLITHKGIEFYKVSLKRERRLLLIGTGKNAGNEMRGFFLKAEVGDMPRIELPPPDKVPCFSFAPINTASATGEELSSFKPHDIALAFLYHEIYIARILPENRKIQLYRVSPKEPPLHSHSLDLSALREVDSIELSVIDNLVVVHAKKSGVSFTFDIKSQRHCTSPITQPLSLGPSQCPYPRKTHQFLWVKPIAISPVKIPRHHSEATGGLLEEEVNEFYQRWKLLWPQRVLDTSSTSGSTWELRLNVCTCALDVDFLMRRGMIKSQLNLVPSPQAAGDVEAAEVAKVGLLAGLRSKLADRPSHLEGEESPAQLYTTLLTPYANTLHTRVNDINSVSNASALENSFGSMFNLNIEDIHNSLNKHCALEPSQVRWPPPPPLARNASTRRGSLLRRGSSGAVEGMKRNSSFPESPSTSTKGNTENQMDGYGGVVVARAIDFKAKISLSSPELVVEEEDLRQPVTEPSAEMDSIRHSMNNDKAWMLCKEMVNDRLDSLRGKKENIAPRDPTHALVVTSQVDFLSLVFEPLARSRTISSPVLAQHMLQFLDVLRSLRIPLVCHHIPALIVALLSRCGQVKDIVQLSQYKAWPQSLTLCLELVKASDVHRARMKQRFNSEEPSDVMGDTTGQVIEQLALDSLWRCGEGVVVVGRLLSRGKILEAISICNTSMRTTEDVPHSKAMESLQHVTVKDRLPSHKFLSSTMQALSQYPHDEDKSLHRRYDLLTTLVLFLKRWDMGCLARTDEGGSKLAEALPNLFSFELPLDEAQGNEIASVSPQLVYGLSADAYRTLRHQLGFDIVRSIHDL